MSTTSSTSSTGTITSMGVGSGLDVSSIITQLMSAESKPLVQLQSQASSINTQISAVGQIQSLASTLNDKIRALTNASLWKGVAATSGDATVVTADTSAGGASPGTYAVTVQSLAQTQTATSGTFASSTSTLSAGKLTIELGTWTGSPVSGFNAKANTSAISIDIGDGDTSLESIRDKINAAGAGVQATIINDANGARLSLRSSATGAENGFRITAQETVDDGDAATGLSALSYDALGASQLTLNQAAGNAKATINGIAIESTTNTLANVADGLSITVNKVSTSPVNLTLSTDTAAMTTAINAFVSAYNSLNSYVRSQTKYDAESKTGGPLQGDPSIIGFANQLRSIVTQDSTASAAFPRLSSIGITLQKDGSLSVDSSKLSKALATPAEVQKLFSANVDDPAGDGFATRMNATITSALSLGGRLDSRETGLRDLLNRNSDRQEQMQDRLDATQKRFEAQFQALDTKMATLSALSAYVTQQVTLMNNSSN